MNKKENIVHTGQAPARRPPEDEPERVGEGELGDGPSAGEINPREEFDDSKEKPLTPDSPLVEDLHRNRRRADDQLRTGSRGDAARPGKEGRFGDPIPPREDLA